MGLKSSSFIANTSFLHSTELQGLGFLTRCSRERYAIKHYSRYVDNLFFICSPDFQRIQHLIRDCKFGMKPFIGTVEEISVGGVDFLDVSLSKDDVFKHTGRITVTPFLKSTALLQALNMRSSHCASVHSSWMIAYMMRLRRHSTNIVWFRAIKDEVLSRMRAAGIDHAIVKEVDRASSYTWPLSIPDSWIRPMTKPFKQKSVWVSLPYHPVCSKAFNTSLNELSCNSHWKSIIHQFLGDDLGGFKAAWRLSMPSLSQVVKRLDA